MANIRAKGIIIKQSNYGDGHRLLNIFAEDYGIIKAVSYGAEKSKSAASAASQMLRYGYFDLYKGARHLLSLNAVETIDAFYPVSENIEKLSLAAYMSDIAYGILGENNADNNVLRLYLNSIYALAYKSVDIQKIKTVYEFKIMSECGYAPQTEACVRCGNEKTEGFDILSGGVVCGECFGKNTIKINETVKSAISHIVNSDIKKMLSFNANAELLEYLNGISERYVAAQLDTEFKSLSYYNSIRGL